VTAVRYNKSPASLRLNGGGFQEDKARLLKQFSGMASGDGGTTNEERGSVLLMSKSANSALGSMLVVDFGVGGVFLPFGVVALAFGLLPDTSATSGGSLGLQPAQERDNITRINTSEIRDGRVKSVGDGGDRLQVGKHFSQTVDMDSHFVFIVTIWNDVNDTIGNQSLHFTQFQQFIQSHSIKGQIEASMELRLGRIVHYLANFLHR
jgi:hypothetical protein